MSDLISRQAALVAVKDALMAWSYMPERRDGKILEAIAELPSAQPTFDARDTQYNLPIGTDLISRAQAIEDVKTWEAVDSRERRLQKDVIEWLKEFPSAQPKLLQPWEVLVAQAVLPQPKMGKWIYHIDDLFPAESTMECNQCHAEQPLTCNDEFCPHCGAKMEVTE